jgi:hypothetical protein
VTEAGRYVAAAGKMLYVVKLVRASSELEIVRAQLSNWKMVWVMYRSTMSVYTTACGDARPGVGCGTRRVTMLSVVQSWLQLTICPNRLVEVRSRLAKTEVSILGASVTAAARGVSMPVGVGLVSSVQVPSITFVGYPARASEMNAARHATVMTRDCCTVIVGDLANGLSSLVLSLAVGGISCPCLTSALCTSLKSGELAT